ncbi:MAG TPA: formyltransferase family protein, partial [Agitococcus sp.]|nr:formyltransferase family protein [Agitococcus sp.]
MKIVVLISGSGSNLQAIIDACQSGYIAGQVVGVLSNKADAYGLVRAQQAGI